VPRVRFLHGAYKGITRLGDDELWERKERIGRDLSSIILQSKGKKLARDRKV
jgi:hypothetical protein